MRFRIQAIACWRCNNYDFKFAGAYAPNGACQYCNLYAPMEQPSPERPSFVTFYGKDIPIAREMSPNEWIAGLDMVGGRPLIDFTGGEPLLYSGFPELVEGLRGIADWAITSNTQLTKVINRVAAIPGSPCAAWTASWHPRAGFPIEQFIENLEVLRAFNVPVSVTVVLHRSTKDVIREHLARFANARFRTQIHLFLAPGYALATDEDREIHALYEELKGINRLPTEDWDEPPIEVLPIRDCVAGQSSAVVDPVGRVWLCYEHMLEDAPPIGQWGEWVPQKHFTRGCTWTCRFPCDQKNLLLKPAAVA